MSTTSERLKEAMRIRNMKQIDILSKTGLTKGALSSYLSGRYEPKQKNLHALAQALDVSEAWLMGLDVPMLPPAPAAAPPSTPDLDSLVAKYGKLNTAGKEKLQERADELISMGYTEEEEIKKKEEA